MTSQEARRAALLELGGVEKRKEECRDTRRVNWIQDLMQDFHFGLRMLRKSKSAGHDDDGRIAEDFGRTKPWIPLLEPRVEN